MARAVRRIGSRKGRGEERGEGEREARGGSLLILASQAAFSAGLILPPPSCSMGAGWAAWEGREEGEGEGIKFRACEVDHAAVSGDRDDEWRYRPVACLDRRLRLISVSARSVEREGPEESAGVQLLSR